MTLSHYNKDNDVKTNWIPIILTIVMACIGAYVGLVKDSITRVEAQTMVDRSEVRSTISITKIGEQQEQLLDRVQDIQIKLGVLLNESKKVR